MWVTSAFFSVEGCMWQSEGCGSKRKSIPLNLYLLGGEGRLGNKSEASWCAGRGFWVCTENVDYLGAK